LRRDVKYNDILREVATQAGAAVVEAGAALEQHPSVYFDYGHFTAEGHRIVVAELLVPVVATKLGL
jgi:hypothetical protein